MKYLLIQLSLFRDFRNVTSRNPLAQFQDVVIMEKNRQETRQSYSINSFFIFRYIIIYVSNNKD